LDMTWLQQKTEFPWSSQDMQGQFSPALPHSRFVIFTAMIRSPADAVYSGSYVTVPNGQLARRPAITRPSSNSISFTRSVNESVSLSGLYLFVIVDQPLCKGCFFFGFTVNSKRECRPPTSFTYLISSVFPSSNSHHVRLWFRLYIISWLTSTNNIFLCSAI
jgi:hypothetical protein